MKKKSILALIANIIILGSCNMKKEDEKPSKSSILNEQKTILPGEWISDIDSMSGISIRADKMAFFKNMTFTSENIYQYELIDSIYKFSDNRDDIAGEYLLAKDFKDTIYYQIIKKSNSSLTLKINDKMETFNLKTKKQK